MDRLGKLMGVLRVKGGQEVISLNKGEVGYRSQSGKGERGDYRGGSEVGYEFETRSIMGEQSSRNRYR
jgi:hypothetical protein